MPSSRWYRGQGARNSPCCSVALIQMVEDRDRLRGRIGERTTPRAEDTTSRAALGRDRNGMRPVANRSPRTGVGVVSPLGDSREAFRDGLLSAQQDQTAAGSRRRLSMVLAARAPAFNPARWIAPMKLRRMDTTSPFALVAIQQAMEDARYVVAAEGDDQTGVCWSFKAELGDRRVLAALFRSGPTGPGALSTVSNAAAGLAGLGFKLRGPNAISARRRRRAAIAAVTC